MNTAGIILLVVFVIVCVFELCSLIFTILKRKKLKNQETKVDVNNVKQEDSTPSSDNVN